MATDPQIGWTFTGLGGTRNLARSLMYHYDIDPDQYPRELADLDDVLGEELLSVARRTLEEQGLLEEVTGCSAST